MVRFLDYLTVKTSQASRALTLRRRDKGHYNRIDATRNKRFAEKTKKFRRPRSHARREEWEPEKSERFASRLGNTT